MADQIIAGLTILEICLFIKEWKTALRRDHEEAPADYGIRYELTNA